MGNGASQWLDMGQKTIILSLNLRITMELKSINLEMIFRCVSFFTCMYTCFTRGIDVGTSSPITNFMYSTLLQLKELTFFTGDGTLEGMCLLTF